MFDTISFCIGEKTIEINGASFSLGELTTQVLNISNDEFEKMFQLAEAAFETMYKNKTPPAKEEWLTCNDKLLTLEQMMLQYRLLNLIKDKQQIIYEAQTYLAQMNLFENDKYEMCESEEELRRMELEYHEYINEWEDDSLQRDLPDYEHGKDIPRELLIFPGDVQRKWDDYCGYCANYMRVLEDIGWFHDTIYNFIKYFLSHLKKLDSENYAAALNDFLYGELADKMISNPLQSNGLYARSDKMQIEYIPRETYEGSGEYKIYTYYQVNRLQAFLKTDFYEALKAGFIIRQCEYCGRCFLLKKAYHTKYCDNPSPDNPKYTCAQLGYRKRGIKETITDNPKAQSLQRCLDRIEKDYTRKNITTKDKDLLNKTLRDIYHRDVTHSGISNDDFEKSLATNVLYPKCGVIRKTKRRGRPKS